MIAKWLGIPTEMIRWPGGLDSPEPSTVPDIVEVHLRADKDLGHEQAMAPSEIFRTLYDRLASGRRLAAEQAQGEVTRAAALPSIRDPMAGH